MLAGRQCSASSLLLRGEFEEALPFLDSIAEFCSGEDAYNWNLGMARAAAGEPCGDGWRNTLVPGLVEMAKTVWLASNKQQTEACVSAGELSTE